VNRPRPDDAGDAAADLEPLIARLKERHGAVVILTGAGEQVIVRRPTPDDWRTFRRDASGRRRHLAAERFFRACCLHPAGRELDELLERRPAAAESFLDKLLELAGADPDVQARTY
jgi:hypothetical protein